MLVTAASGEPVDVVASNFVRAETDHYCADMAARGVLGAIQREIVSVDDQLVIRMNRDTLYSQVFDLGAGPVKVTTPETELAGQFGGCEASDGTPNCLPITEGWNDLVRFYRPREEILSVSGLPSAHILSSRTTRRAMRRNG